MHSWTEEEQSRAKPVAAGRHDVLVVAEDGEGVGGKRPGGDVEDAGQQFAGDLVHVGEHQEEPLRGGEGRGQGAGDQRAVHRAGRARLRLQLPDLQDLAEDVFAPLGRPLVGDLPHGGGRGDRVDRGGLAHGVRHVGRSRVAVHRFHFSGHFWTPFS